MGDRRPRVDDDLQADGYAGARCEVCGTAPATLRVRRWEHERGGTVRSLGAVETHYFCSAHREQADRMDEVLRARAGG